MIQGVRRRASAEIKGSRARMDAQTFADWLRSEMGKANAEPALKVFDIGLRPFYSTPEDAARSLADVIEFDLCTFLNEAKQAVTDPTRVNWKEQFESAEPILVNYRPEKSDGWKFRREFTNYIAAIKAETRAITFASYDPNRGMTEMLPVIREEYEKVKNRPYLVKDRNQKGNGFAALLADILTEAKQEIASGNASFLSNEDTEMILHFADLVSAEMRVLVQTIKEGFDRQKIALEAHLRQNGYIVPADFEEFADWFFGVKFHGANLQKLVSEAKVKEEHFAEFSKWKEGKLTRSAEGAFEKAELPAFADLFVNGEVVESALEAARGIDPPMIYANDQWTGEYKKLPGLLAFYEFCNDKDYLKKPTNKKSALDAISSRFTGKKVGKNAPQMKPDIKLKEKLLLFNRPK